MVQLCKIRKSRTPEQLLVFLVDPDFILQPPWLSLLNFLADFWLPIVACHANWPASAAPVPLQHAILSKSLHYRQRRRCRSNPLCRNSQAHRVHNLTCPTTRNNTLVSIPSTISDCISAFLHHNKGVTKNWDDKTNVQFAILSSLSLVLINIKNNSIIPDKNGYYYCAL